MRTIFAIPAVLLHLLLGVTAHPSQPLIPELDPLTLHTLYNSPTSLQARAHPSGQIILQSPSSQEIPFSFTISPETCAPLESEISCLVNDLSTIILDSHPAGIRPEAGCHDNTARLSESVSMLMSRHEYRATIELSLTEEMSREELEGLMSLLGKTVTVIGDEREKMGMQRGAGSMVIETTMEGVGVHARWTFYEVVGGEAVLC